MSFTQLQFKMSCLHMALLLCTWIGSSLAVAPLAILRPFSPQDADQLLASFELWEEYLPCDPSKPLASGVEIHVVSWPAALDVWAALRQCDALIRYRSYSSLESSTIFRR